MAHAKAEFMGTVEFGGPAAAPKPMPYDPDVLKAIVNSGKLV
jgi:hypothetical protein